MSGDIRDPAALRRAENQGRMRVLNSIVEAIDSVARAFVVVSVSVITIVMLAQVFFRYVINDSLQWSEEFSIYTLIWTVFIGSVMLVRNWEHIAIPTFINMVSLPGRGWLFVLAKILSIVFFCLVAYWGSEYVEQRVHARSPSMGFSVRWVRLSIPIGSALMVLFTVNEIIRDILAIRAKDSAYFARLGEGGSL
jgi:TRAP-type C4-dicarboxylate transport system permease small subunit